MSHFPQSVGVISTKPTLVLGAQNDIIYPPHLLVTDFDERFPNAAHKTVPNQAHYFMDPVADGEKSMEDTIKDCFKSLVDKGLAKDSSSSRTQKIKLI